MNEIKVDIEVVDTDNKLLIKGINGQNLEIDYSGDVDFTNLVELLTDLIDKNNSIKLNSPTGFDEGKISIVLNTVGQIFQKYNDSLTVVSEEGQVEFDLGEDDDLPF